MPEPLRQYVILRHVVADGRHWDLMLEQGETLATWQLARDPAVLAPEDAGEIIPAKRIGDHRRAYLEYEGPVFGQRGHVTRVDKGTYELITRTPTERLVRLHGDLLRGLFRVAGEMPGVEGTLQRVGG